MMHLHGVYPAVLVPRHADGQLNEPGFREILTFLRNHGMDRVVVNGATGEYCLTSPRDLRRMLEICAETLGSHGSFLCGIGAPAANGAIELGRLALEGGARGLLLPMPYFFPYAQEDLRMFCSTVAAALPSPVLLYNLPRFTTPLELQTVRSLLASVPNLAGIKDSSGSLELLRGLNGTKACRIVGDDSVLVAALDAAVCDAVVSGVAGVLPELSTFLFHQRQSVHYRQAAKLLDELIGRLSVFPVPWGLKIVADCRGMVDAEFLHPLSENRVEQICAFRDWFPGWWARTEEIVSVRS